MVNPIVVGIIGAGRIGRLHADNLRMTPLFKLKSIAEPVVSDELLAWAGSRNLGSIFVNGEELLNDSEIEAVFICTPTDSHAYWIEQAARAKKHIFCEKPISLSSAQTSRALQCVKEEGVLLQVGFNRRMDPSFRRLKQLVESGELGSPHIVKITSRDPQPPGEAYVLSSGGMFMDMTIHDFDMARYLMGEEVAEVYTRGANLIDPMIGRCGDVDTAVITLTFASGAICVIDNSRKAVYGYDQRVEVFGSLGSATADNCRPTTVEVSTAASVTRDQPLHFFLERYNQAFSEEVAAFARSIRLQEPVICSGLDGQQAERIAEAAKESHLTGLPVKLTLSAGEELSARQVL